MYQYLSKANFALGELKGLLTTTKYYPTISRLLHFKEAKESCEIDHIRASVYDIFRDSITSTTNSNTRPIYTYVRATNILFRDISIQQNLTINNIHSIQSLIVPDKPGLRQERGTKIYNTLTNQVLYVPPQNKSTIIHYYENLIDYFNQETNLDPLIKSAIIHYQFECIHPYISGNGRIGRILFGMSLVKENRINIPLLTLSSYLNTSKEIYFEKLKMAHNNFNDLEPFIEYIIEGIYESATYTVNFIKQITRIIVNSKEIIQKRLPKLYSEQLVNHLFMFPFTKNEMLRTSLNISRTTSTNYLKALVQEHILEEQKVGKEVLYFNTYMHQLFEI
jgi:Fic family protein